MTGRQVSVASQPRIGLALAGGGPEGAVYEIGALRALDEALDGVDLNNLTMYVGVSAGSFIASCLANQLTPVQMCRALVKPEPGEHPFVPEVFFTPALGEVWKRGRGAPRLLLDALVDYATNSKDQRLLVSLTRLSGALPLGLFENEPLRVYLEQIFSIKNRTNDFRCLQRPLIVVAAELESGKPVRFGADGFDHVPISRAVQASTALPGLYPPVEIDGRYYVDGVLLKTLHASVLLDAGVDLVLGINPLVPVNTLGENRAGVTEGGDLVDRGLPTVLAQTFRTLIHSRMTVGMSVYEQRYAEADVVLFEPHRDDYDMFFTNIFRFSSRREVCEHAYQATRRDLLRRRRQIEPVLARYGIGLRDDVLRDKRRDLWSGVESASARSSVSESLDHVLDRLEALLERDGS